MTKKKLEKMTGAYIVAVWYATSEATTYQTFFTLKSAKQFAVSELERLVVSGVSIYKLTHHGTSPIESEDNDTRI